MSIREKIDKAREVYERYALDLTSLEADLDKKHKDKLSRLKGSSQEFLQHQKEAMEMVSKVTRNIYRIIEKIAEKEIDKDPIAFIRE